MTCSKIADEYDTRFGKTLETLENEVKSAKEFIGMKSGGRMLDYACGTGMLSRVRLRFATLPMTETLC